MYGKKAPVSLELGSCWASAGDPLFTGYRLQVTQNHPLVVGICSAQQKIEAATDSFDLVADRIFSRQCFDAFEQRLLKQRLYPWCPLLVIDRTFPAQELVT